MLHSHRPTKNFQLIKSTLAWKSSSSNQSLNSFNLAQNKSIQISRCLPRGCDLATHEAVFCSNFLRLCQLKQEIKRMLVVDNEINTFQNAIKVKLRGKMKEHYEQSNFKSLGTMRKLRIQIKNPTCSSSNRKHITLNKTDRSTKEPHSYLI